MISALPAAMLTLFLSYLFVVSGSQKLSDLRSFQHTLAEYQILPPNLLTLGSRFIPVAEVLAGIGLLIPDARLLSLIALAVLLATYTGAIALNILRGRADLDCGCSGPGQAQTISSWLLGRNSVLLVVVLLLALTPVIAVQGLLGWGVAFLGAIASALTYHAADQLIANNTLLRRIAHHG